MVDWKFFLHPLRTPKFFTTQNLASTPKRFSQQELVETNLFVVSNVKDPFNQRGETLANFFDEGLLSSMSYNHISPRRYFIVSAGDFCMSFDRRYTENSEADTIAPLHNCLSYPREPFATITRLKRYHHAELWTQRYIIVCD